MPSTDSLLNDYLDDRLDPAARRRLERALQSDTRLAESLRALTEVRDLLAALPRDRSVNVAPRVLARIMAGNARSRFLRLGRVLSPGARIALAGSLAASVLALAGIALVESHFRFDGRPLFSSRVSVAVRPPIQPAQRVDATAPVDATAARALSDPESPVISVVRRFIDNPGLHRVFSMTGSDELDQRVASVVAQTTRYNYLRLSIAQGIVIDPRHPEEAAVYAAVLPEQDVQVLRDRLRAVVGDQGLAEADVDPALAVQLSEITVAQAFRPRPRADVVIPTSSLALRFGDPVPEGEDPLAELDPAAESDQPTPEQYRSAPIAVPPEPASARAPADPAANLPLRQSAAAQGSGQPRGPTGRETTSPNPAPGVQASPQPLSVVLVWVARSPRGG